MPGGERASRRSRVEQGLERAGLGLPLDVGGQGLGLKVTCDRGLKEARCEPFGEEHSRRREHRVWRPRGGRPVWRELSDGGARKTR